MHISLIFKAFAVGAVLGSSTVAADRDPSFPACDAPSDFANVTYSQELAIGYMKANNHMSGVAGRYTNSKEESDDPVVYVAPGTGACGITYTDDDFGACLKPGWVNSANVNGCNKWIQATSDASGISVYVRVVDACGASSNTTFGCNDLFLTKAAFTALAGSNSSEALQTGHLPGNVSWEFTNEPCGFCAMGYPGKLPCSGENDPCIGPDHDSVMRPGRLNLTAADSAAICRSPLTSMTKVKASASISSCS